MNTDDTMSQVETNKVIINRYFEAYAYAIASLVEKTHLKEDYVIPKVNDPRILPFVTQTLKATIGKHAQGQQQDLTISKMSERRFQYMYDRYLDSRGKTAKR